MQQLELFNNSIIPYIGNYMTRKTQLKKLIIEKFRALKNVECSRPQILRNITVKSEKSEILAVSHFKRLKIAKFEK